MKEVRKIRIEGDVAYVPLTKGLEAIIDTADVHLVDGFNWFSHVQAHTAYARRVEKSGGKKNTVYMHHVILGMTEGAECDHRDGNGLNNRRSNLRESTRSQNNQNRGVHKNSSSGKKGVFFHKREGQWRAQIHFEGKCFFLGRFLSAEQASAAYAKACSKLHGEFGRLE